MNVRFWKIIIMSAILLLNSSSAAIAQSGGVSKERANPLVHSAEWSKCCRFITIGVDSDRIDFLKPYAAPAAARIRNVLKLPGLGDPIDIVVTRDLEDFKQAMPRIGRHQSELKLGDWVAGIAFPAHRLVVLRLGHFPAREIRSTLVHELAHIYVSEAAALRPVPRWFNEAVAMLLSDEQTHQHLENVLAAKAYEQIPDFEELEWGFTAHRSKIHQSYAASFAFLRWAIETRGGEHLVTAVLHRLAANQEFKVAFRTVFGASVSDLQELWLSETQTSRWFPIFFRFGDIVWVLMVVIFIWGVIVTLKKRRKKMARMAVRESFIYGDDLTWDTVDRAMGKNWWARRKARRARAREQAHRESFEIIDGGRTESDEEPLIH